MSGFYYNENNFNCLYNDISILLSDTVVESAVAVEWIHDYYNFDNYNITKAIEMYMCDLLLSKLDINNEYVNNLIEDYKCKIYSKDLICLETLMNNLHYLQIVDVNEKTLNGVLETFTLYESLDYLQEQFNLKEKVKNFKIEHEGIKKLLTITESLKRIAKTKTPGSEELECIKEGIDKFLYEHKSFDYDGKAYRAGVLKGVLAHKADKMNCADILEMFDILKDMSTTNPDYLIKYVIEEFNYINKIIIDKEKQLTPIEESTNQSLYLDKIAEFDNLVESIFFDDGEPSLKDFMRLCKITEALINYEDTMEASSRIITKGAGKVVKAIDNVSAKTSGMSSAKSKMGQVTRDARVASTRISDAINKKLNDILAKKKEERRKRVVTGSITVKLVSLLKKTIGYLIGGKLVGMVFGPVAGVAVTIITALVKHVLDKNADEKERKLALREMETELKIVREKIEDAKGDNARKQKYELMRIEASLEKELQRVKYGLRPE